MVASADLLVSVLAQILVVSKFADMFIDEVLKLPQSRMWSLTLILALSTTPISRAQYWMASLDLGSLSPNYKSCWNKALSAVNTLK